MLKILVVYVQLVSGFVLPPAQLSSPSTSIIRRHSIDIPTIVTTALGEETSRIAANFLSDVDGGILVLQFLTSLFASVFGFGDALLAMPLLAVVFGMDASTAAPLVSVVSTAMIAANLAVDAKSGQMRTVGRWKTSLGMLSGAALGVPLGVRALVAIDPDIVRFLVGFVLIFYGLLKLAPSTTENLQQREFSSKEEVDLFLIVPFGFLAGFLGGAVAEPGPPAVLLSQIANWSPITTRLLLFRFFLPVQVLAIADYNENSLLTPFVYHQAIATLPIVALAVAVGTKLNRKIKPDLFSELVAAIILLLGIFCSSTAAGPIIDHFHLLGSSSGTTLLFAHDPLLASSSSLTFSVPHNIVDS